MLTVTSILPLAPLYLLGVESKTFWYCWWIAWNFLFMSVEIRLSGSTVISCTAGGGQVESRDRAGGGVTSEGVSSTVGSTWQKCSCLPTRIGASVVLLMRSVWPTD